MVIQKSSHSDAEMIKKVKNAINARKYAHTNEINLLWQDAMPPSSIISWRKVILGACIASTFILLIS